MIFLLILFLISLNFASPQSNDDKSDCAKQKSLAAGLLGPIDKNEWLTISWKTDEKILNTLQFLPDLQTFFGQFKKWNRIPEPLRTCFDELLEKFQVYRKAIEEGKSKRSDSFFEHLEISRDLIEKIVYKKKVDETKKKTLLKALKTIGQIKDLWSRDFSDLDIRKYFLNTGFEYVMYQMRPTDHYKEFVETCYDPVEGIEKAINSFRGVLMCEIGDGCFADKVNEIFKENPEISEEEFSSVKYYFLNFVLIEAFELQRIVLACVPVMEEKFEYLKKGLAEKWHKQVNETYFYARDVFKK